VQLSIKHNRPDKTPFHLSFTSDVKKNVAEYFKNDNLDSQIDNHLVVYKARLPYVEIFPDYWQDEFGVLWDRTHDKSLGVVTNYQLKDKTQSNYFFPNPNNPDIYQGLNSFIQKNPTRFRIVNIGHALFERAWSLRGMVPLMMDMVDDPKYVEELMDNIVDYQLGLIKNLANYDVDAIMFGDDWGQQKSLLFSPKMWRRFIKPRLKVLFAAVKNSQKSIFLHSCGQVQSLIPDLIEIGLDVFNPFQPDVMDIYEIKKEFGNDLTFYGGVSVQSLLPFGTPEEIKKTVKKLNKLIGQDGGYIIAPSHDIPGDVPLNNILALINAVQDQ